MDLHQSIHWLQKEADRLIRASKRVMQDGTAAFPPQVGSHYEAFWLRDYEYLLEGAIDVFTDEQLHDACALFTNSLAEDGSGVDCILFDGKPIYRPGYGTMGENPVTDGGPFTVGVAWHMYQRTGNRALIERSIDDLVRTLKAVPLYDTEPLVYIDPDRQWDRCPYGFTDQIRKTGCVLFSSLLYARACRQLADLLTAVGRKGEARAWAQTSSESNRCINTTFWDEEMGLYRAATISCREHDIWGSVFAVYSAIATDDQAVRIAEYLRKHYEGLILHGQLRHLPEGIYWQRGARRMSIRTAGIGLPR